MNHAKKASILNIMCLFIAIVISFKSAELITTLFWDYLRSGGDIFIFVVKMIFRNVNGVSVRNLGKFLAGGSEIFVPDE